MKKYLSIIILILSVSVAIFIGYNIGKKHVIMNQMLYTDNGIIYADIDGELYYYND